MQAAINAAAPDLPSGLKNAPIYRKANPNNAPVLLLALTSKSRRWRYSTIYADSLLAQRIRQLDGVSDVSIAGGATPAVRVDLNLRALTAMGLSPDQIRNALVAANVTSPQGFLSDGKTSMAIVANDSLHTADEFADLDHRRAKTACRSACAMSRTVSNGQEDQYPGRVVQRPARDSDDRAQAGRCECDRDGRQHLRSTLPLMRSWLPDGVALTPFSDRTGTIRASVQEVQISLLISLCLVILVMLLFLRRLAPTVIAGFAAPLSLAGAFIVMYALGFTLDNLSLMALVISIGFVVDDAIVVIENIVRHLDAGESRMQAALERRA